MTVDGTEPREPEPGEPSPGQSGSPESAPGTPGPGTPEPNALERDTVAQFQGQGRRLASMVAVLFGAFMHLMVGAFVFASGGIAPPWAVGGLIAAWTTGTWLIWRWRRIPEVVLVIPMVVAAILWLTVTLGDRYFGWAA